MGNGEKVDSRGILGAILIKTRRVKEKKQGWISPFPRAEVRDWGRGWVV